MKKISIVTILLLGIIHGNAQVSNDAKSYHEIVHRANLQTAKGNYEEASSLFERGFSKMSSAFWVDINNALYAEVRREKPDEDLIEKYLVNLQSKGTCVHENYKKRPLVAPYTLGIDHKQCGKVKNERLSNSFRKMIEQDQAVRRLHPEIYHPSVISQIKSVDSANYYAVQNTLRHCLKNHQRIEDEIGAIRAGEMIVMLRHSGPWGLYNKPLLDSLCMLGLVDVREVEILYEGHCTSSMDNNKIKSNWRYEHDCEKKSMYGNFMMLFNRSTALLIIPKAEELAQINKKRVAINLQDLIECQQLRIFNFYDKEGFVYTGERLFQLEEEWINQLTLSHIENGRKVIRYDKRKILILTESNDITADKVCSWLSQ